MQLEGEAVSDPERGPVPINYSITAMALVITARALAFDPTMRFNSITLLFTRIFSCTLLSKLFYFTFILIATRLIFMM